MSVSSEAGLEFVEYSKLFKSTDYSISDVVICNLSLLILIRNGVMT